MGDDAVWRSVGRTAGGDGSPADDWRDGEVDADGKGYLRRVSGACVCGSAVRMQTRVDTYFCLYGMGAKTAAERELTERNEKEKGKSTE